MLRHSILKFAVLLLAVCFTPPVHAWICSVPPFLDRVQDADNVFVARVTNVVYGQDRWGRKNNPEAQKNTYVTFDVTERFKGDIPFERISGAELLVGAVSFRVGEEYLVYASDSGEIYGCTAKPLVENDEAHPRQLGFKELQALRASEKTDLTDIVAPWYLYEITDKNGVKLCSLQQEFHFDVFQEEGRLTSGTLRVDWAYGKKPENVPRTKWPVLQLSIDVLGLSQITNWFSKVSVRGVDHDVQIKIPGDSHAARYFLDELDKRPDLMIMGHHPSVGEIAIPTHARNLGDTLTRMRACMTQH